MIDIEIMPVIVLVGVLSAIVLPRFSDVDANVDTQIESNEQYIKLKQKIDSLNLNTLAKDKYVRILNGESILARIKTIKDASDNIKSYMSYMTMVEENNNENQPFIQWEIKYVYPDKLLVMQTAEEETGTIYDRWMSIGEELYFQIGEWFKDDGHATGHDQTNKSMGLLKWVEILEENVISNAKIVEVNERSYIMLEFTPKSVKKIGFFSDVQVVKEKHIEVWIDADSNLIQKAVLQIDGNSFGPDMGNVVLAQYFGAYNSDIVIQKPKKVYDIADAEKVLKPDKGN